MAPKPDFDILQITDLAVDPLADPGAREPFATYQSELIWPQSQTGLIAGYDQNCILHSYIDLAIAAVLGNKWYGKFQIERQGRVLLALGIDEHLLQERLSYHWERLAARDGLTSTDEQRLLNYLSYCILDLSDLDNYKENLEAAIEHYNGPGSEWSLLIVDPYWAYSKPSLCAGAESIDYYDWLDSLRACEGSPNVISGKLMDGLSQNYEQWQLASAWPWVLEIYLAGTEETHTLHHADYVATVLSKFKGTYTEPIKIHW